VVVGAPPAETAPGALAALTPMRAIDAGASGLPLVPPASVHLTAPAPQEMPPPQPPTGTIEAEGPPPPVAAPVAVSLVPPPIATPPVVVAPDSVPQPPVVPTPPPAPGPQLRNDPRYPSIVVMPPPATGSGSSIVTLN
jgi:hypothetical protein